MKKVIVLFDIPDMTSEQFNLYREDLRKAGYAHPKGLISHVSGPEGKNWCAVDTWESKELFEDFNKNLKAVLKQHKITQVEPVILPLYYEYATPQTATR